MAEELTRIIDLTSSLTEEKLVEMIRELRFGKRLISTRDIMLIAHLLLKLGMSISAISRELRISRKTVQKTAREIMKRAKLFRSLLGAFPPVEVDEAYQNAGLKGIKNPEDAD